MLLMVTKAVLGPLYLREKELYLNPAGTSQTIQAIVFSAGQKFRTLSTGRSGLAALVGVMVMVAMAVAVLDGKTTVDTVLVPDPLRAGEVAAAVIVSVTV